MIKRVDFTFHRASAGFTSPLRFPQWPAPLPGWKVILETNIPDKYYQIVTEIVTGEVNSNTMGLTVEFA